MAKMDDQAKQPAFIRRITMTVEKFPSGVVTARDALEILSQDAVIHHFATQFGEINPLHTQINTMGDNSILISVAFATQEGFVKSANYSGPYGTSQIADTPQTPLQAALKRGFFVTDTLSNPLPTTDQVCLLLVSQLKRAFPNREVVAPVVKKNNNHQFLVYFHELVHLFFFMENSMVSQVKPYLKCVSPLSTTNVPGIFRLFCTISYPHLITNSEIRSFFEQIEGEFQGVHVKGVRAFGIGMMVNRNTGKRQNKFFLFVRDPPHRSSSQSPQHSIFTHWCKN